jgi:hypothetical protein
VFANTSHPCKEDTKFPPILLNEISHPWTEGMKVPPILLNETLPASGRPAKAITERKTVATCS